MRLHFEEMSTEPKHATPFDFGPVAYFAGLPNRVSSITSPERYVCLLSDEWPLRVSVLWAGGGARRRRLVSRGRRSKSASVMRRMPSRSSTHSLAIGDGRHWQCDLGSSRNLMVGAELNLKLRRVSQHALRRLRARLRSTMAPHALRERVPQTPPHVLVEMGKMQESMDTSGATQLGGHGGVQLARWQSERQIGQTSVSSGGAVLYSLPCRLLARTSAVWSRWAAMAMSRCGLLLPMAAMACCSAVSGGLWLVQQAALEVAVLAAAVRHSPRHWLAPSAAVCGALRHRRRLVWRRASAARAMVDRPSRRRHAPQPVLRGHNQSGCCCRCSTARFVGDAGCTRWTSTSSVARGGSAKLASRTASPLLGADCCGCAVPCERGVCSRACMCGVDRVGRFGRAGMLQIRSYRLCACTPTRRSRLCSTARGSHRQSWCR